MLKKLRGEKDQVRALDSDLDKAKSQRRDAQKTALGLADQLRGKREPQFVDSELELAEKANKDLKDGLNDVNKAKAEKEAELQKLVGADGDLKGKLRELEAHKEVDVGL